MTETAPQPDIESGKSRQANFEELVRLYQKPLVGLAYRMLGNLEDARDQVQEAFVRFWQLSSWPDRRDDVRALLSRIVINRAIDTLRRMRRFRWIELSKGEVELSEAAASPDEVLQSGDLHRVIEVAAAKLKPRQKAVFVLRDIEGYSVRETARILDCKENNVLVNLHLARKKLQKLLSPFLEE